MMRRPQVSGAESPMDPKRAWPAGGANPPWVNASAGSIEKRSGSVSQSGVYSKTIVSFPCTLLLRAKPTGRARPSRSIWTSMSAMSGWPLCALEADALRQLGAGKGLADAIAADVGDFSETVEEAERLQDGGIDADADIGVARFDPLQGRARCESALGHHGHRQPSAP